MKVLLRKHLPEPLLIFSRRTLVVISTLRCYFYDFNRYIRGTNSVFHEGQQKLLGKLVLYYHVIEKGLSFENRRDVFGTEVMSELIESVNEYLKKNYDRDQLQFKTACSNIEKFFEVMPRDNPLVDGLRQKCRSEIALFADPKLGGVKVLSKHDIRSACDFDFKRFFEARHSIREFSSEEVDISVVLEALSVAQNYPSVCNRQAIRVRLIQSKELINAHLAYQNGNRGFGDKINKLLVITSDLTVFVGPSERNQPFIDGGIYLMGILLSLHGVGLGAVPLNWSTNRDVDTAYRSFSGISDNEVIISFVGIGHLKEKMLVPKSERNNIKDILTVVG